jgi:hypothetical protein
MIAHMPLEKARNAGISLYPSEIEKLRALAGVSDQGNVSNFLRRILADDLAAPAAEVSPHIVTRLAHHYTPTEARGLASRLAATDQPALLARLLREIAECLEAGMAAESLHVAGAHEISAEPVAAAALRYAPRLPRNQFVTPTTYPDTPPSIPPHETAAPIKPGAALTTAQLGALAALVRQPKRRG